jgi:hypothetical protein
MYRCAEARAVGDHTSHRLPPRSSAITSWRESAPPASCQPLIVLLQHGVGFRGVEVIGRGEVMNRQDVVTARMALSLPRAVPARDGNDGFARHAGPPKASSPSCRSARIPQQ